MALINSANIFLLVIDKGDESVGIFGFNYEIPLPLVVWLVADCGRISIHRHKGKSGRNATNTHETAINYTGFGLGEVPLLET